MTEEIISGNPRRIPRWAWIAGSIFLALALLIIVPRLILRYQISAELKALKALGYPTTLDELDAWYPQPKGLNAAGVLNSAFALYNPSNFHGVPLVSVEKLPPLGEPLPADMKAKTVTYLADNAKALELLHKGAAIPECRFPIPLRGGPAMRLDHLAQMRQGARLLELQAIVKATDGDADGAADSVKAAFGLSRSLREEPLLISQLVRIAVHMIAMRATERVLSQTALSDNRLQELAALAEAEEDRRALERAMACEACESNATFSDPRFMPALMNGGTRFGSAPLTVYRFSGLLEKEQLEYLRWMNQRMIPDARRPLPEAIKDQIAFQKKINKALKPRFFLGIPPAASIVSGYPIAFEAFGRDAAHLRTMRAVIAVERYRLAQGRLPDTLNALVPDYLKEIPADPFGGLPLRYKVSAKGYVIYSISVDMKDDGGAENYEWGDRGGDIAFHVNR